MWVKRTEAEIAQERRRQRRSRLWACALFGAFIMLMLTGLFGWQVAARRGRITVPANELLSRLPYATIAGILCGFVMYKWERKRLPIMICPKCEATKYADSLTQCSCGGQFEMMEVMKYVGRKNECR